MAETTTSEPAPALADGTANKTPGSRVKAHVKPEPAAYLRLDTGELYTIPAGDITSLNNEFDKWNRLIYEQLLANKALAFADERLDAIARAKANNKASVSSAVETEAQQIQGWAIKWREEATEAVRREMAPLDKLGGSGKKLIEMMPLMEKAGDKPYKLEAGKDNGTWSLKGTDFTRPLAISGAVGLRESFKQEDRYKGLGPLRYMSSDKLKSSWPKFKDKKTMKWADVYQADKQGKRKVDRAKLKQYLGEQVMHAKVNSTDLAKLEIEHTTTLGPEALEKWNANAQASGEGQLIWGATQLGDIDFSAEAAAMRFYSGAGLSAELAPLQGNLKVKAEGSVEVAFAEGKMAGNLYLPSKEGLMLYYLDLEQLSAIAKGNAAGSNKYDLGAIRLVCGAELKGVIGVSLAGEVSIGVEMQDVETKDVDGKIKAGRMPHIKGSRQKTKRKSALDVTGQSDDWKNTAGLAAEVNFFAGAKGGLGLKGAIEWRNPHTKDKKFEPFASIAPEVQGMVGLAGEAKLNIEYVDGIFRITAHAGLCLGVGPEGTLTMAVGAKQLASFVYWMYYNLLHAGFRSLVFIGKEAFEALRSLCYLMVCEGRTIEQYFGKPRTLIDQAIDKLETDYNKAQNCLALAKSINANPARTRFTPPESKGMLIYQLTRFNKFNWVGDGAGFSDHYLPTQRQAVINILRQARIRADLENIIQHISPQGEKGDLGVNLNRLKEFFAAEGPSGLDIPGSRTRFQNDWQNIMRTTGGRPDYIAAAPASKIDNLALNGDFESWYGQVHTSLLAEPARGYEALSSSDPAAALQANAAADHPLYSSAAGGFYTDQA